MLDQNDRIAFAESFAPVSVKERDLLCRILKITNRELVLLSSQKKSSHGSMNNQIQEMFDHLEGKSLRFAIWGAGFRLKRECNDCFIVDFGTLTNVHLNSEKLDLLKLYPLKCQPKAHIQNARPSPGPVIRIPRPKPTSSHAASHQGQNCELEIKKTNYEENDHTIKTCMKY